MASTARRCSSGLPPPWRLDRKESTRRALKYRRGAGEIIIVNHDGRGWRDPRSAAKGDIFDLVRHLDPGLNFGQVRQVLRRFVGIAPSFPEALRQRRRDKPDRPPGERWAKRPRLRRGSPVWAYLAGARGLPAKVLAAGNPSDRHDFMARITAERLVEHLTRSGFVLPKQPPAAARLVRGTTPPPAD